MFLFILVNQGRYRVYTALFKRDQCCVWENVKPHLEQTPNGYIIFDDTVLDKRHAQKISLAQKQYSGNAHTTINGIGVVICVYVNPELDRYWIVDFASTLSKVMANPSYTKLTGFILFFLVLCAVRNRTYRVGSS